MTRSYKHTPCCHCAGHDGSWKAVFNRKVRRNPIDFSEGVSSIPDGNAYRKANESWLIADCKAVGLTFDEYHGSRNGYEHFYIRK